MFSPPSKEGSLRKALCSGGPFPGSKAPVFAHRASIVSLFPHPTLHRSSPPPFTLYRPCLTRLNPTHHPYAWLRSWHLTPNPTPYASIRTLQTSHSGKRTRPLLHALSLPPIGLRTRLTQPTLSLSLSPSLCLVYLFIHRSRVFPFAFPLCFLHRL